MSDDILRLASVKMGGWALVRKECHYLILIIVLHNWDACLNGGSLKESKWEKWSPRH